MSHGGRRKGAGRPANRGPYGEPTKPVRVPVSLTEDIRRFVASKGYRLPLYGSRVAAGFPSPADDYIEKTLDLNTHLIKHPAATFFVRAIGDSMKNAGIHDNDILIVDRSLEPLPGKIAVVALDGQLTVKRLAKSSTGSLRLMPDNPEYSPIEVEEGNEVHVWGIVTSVIHPV